MAKEVLIDRDDAMEIAGHILGVEWPAEDDDSYKLEEMLDYKWNIDIETFMEISNAIFDLVDFGLSPLTQKAYVGIAKPEGVWMVKKEVDQQFLLGIIEWATEGEEIAAKSKGFLKEITKGGAVEYEIVIRRPSGKTKKVIVTKYWLW